MATIFVQSARGSNLVQLQQALNALLAPLLSNRILFVDFNGADSGRYAGIELAVTVTFDDGGAVIATPFVASLVDGRTASEAAANAATLISAQPGYFWSGVYADYADGDGRYTRPFIDVLFSNVTPGASSNWLAGGTSSGGGGGAPSGPAGGDLAGTYPNPTLAPLYNQVTGGPLAVATDTLDTVLASTYGDVEWQLELVKGTTRYSTLIRANSDGTTANFTESCITVSPPAGTFDFTLDVTLSAGNLLLRATPSSTGWSYRLRRRVLAA